MFFKNRRSLHSLYQILSCAMLFGAGVMLASCSPGAVPPTQDASAKVPMVSVSEQGVRAAHIETEAVRKQYLSQDLHLTGRIQPEISREVDVSTRFSGRVLKIEAGLGSAVCKGQILATVDSHDISELQAELIEACSKLEIARSHNERERQIYEEHLQRPKGLLAARSHFEQMKVQLKWATGEFQRQQELYSEKIASAKDFIAAQANLEKLKFEFKEAESALQREDRLFQNKGMLKRDYQLALAEMAREKRHVETLRQRLAFAGLPQGLIAEVEATGHIVAEIPLLSPMSGVVADQHVAVGEMVDPGKNLFTVTDLSEVIVAVDLPEIDMRYARLNGPVKVTVASYPDKIFTGIISFIGERVNPNTRTVSIRAKLSNPEHKLKSHMFAEIDLPGPTQSVLSFPKAALHERDGQKVVYVQVKDGFEQKEVKVGRQFKGYIEALTGLNEGEHVATTGSLLLKTSMVYGR